MLSNGALRSVYDRELMERETVRPRGIDTPSRSDLIADLTAREAQTGRPDPLDVYRRDLRDALGRVSPRRDGLPFDEYERVILSALLGGWPGPD